MRFTTAQVMLNTLIEEVQDMVDEHEICGMNHESLVNALQEVVTTLTTAYSQLDAIGS